MAKANWRSCILVALFALGVAGTPRAAASDKDIPPLRTKENAFLYVFLLSPAVDAFPPPISSLPRNHPFKAIGLEVGGTPAAAELTEFARRAVEARLEELGVAEQIHVIHPSSPDMDGQARAGMLPCDLLRITFMFTGAADGAEGQGVVAIAADMLATQQASNCATDDPRSSWALQAGPRVEIGPWQDEQADLRRSRKLILRFIDAEIVLKILSSNETAAETLRSWQEP